MNGLTIWLAVPALLLAGAGCALGALLWSRETAREKRDRRLRGLEDRTRRLEQEQTQLAGRLYAMEVKQENLTGEGLLPGNFSDQVEKLLCYQAKGRRTRDEVGV
ncbi:MAG: hypothetical protein PHY23_10155 [Oscillospiraceae bacterium]|jgi:hypothetical protein|nr:hypothetical protein [Oscillospiraceae bacterium]